ncbi:MAG TPA: 2-polyprenyl-3-methyl-6-methoxy-1,4-benzoquinone monooxygenase [Burkholderiales bacterium]|nr:2-polyprenyl-3-methyl-6-methoxy-1,4-benzoquinone monooxygenase [Burkholderiales bacterium]
MINLDKFIVGFDKGLRTLFAPAQTLRKVPADALPDAALDDTQRRTSAALMRVNHSGEICAQALYQGQALTARDASAKQALEQAAQEETEHLAWTERRIAELGGSKSVLNPLFYAGSFAIGALSGLLGDKWNLGFLAETERQVVRHLEGHLERLPADDHKSRAIVEQMRDDEAGHATSAVNHGGAELPAPVKAAMKASSKVMTNTAYWL